MGSLDNARSANYRGLRSDFNREADLSNIRCLQNFPVRRLRDRIVYDSE